MALSVNFMAYLEYVCSTLCRSVRQLSQERVLCIYDPKAMQSLLARDEDLEPPSGSESEYFEIYKVAISETGLKVE